MDQISDLSIFKLISANYASLVFDSKKDVLYSSGAYSRYVFIHEKNYELAIELCSSVQNMNLIAGDYQGFATASSFISMSYNKLYEKSKDQELFNKAFYFNEEVYYELENGYITLKGKANPSDAISQFIVFVNWIELISMNVELSENMKKSLSNAISDFSLLFEQKDGKINVISFPAVQYYIDSFKEFSKSSIIKEIKELEPLFRKINFSS